MVILIDHFAASASEIVAACLQIPSPRDDHWTTVLGKGTVQRLIELEGGRSALRLTTATYLSVRVAEIYTAPPTQRRTLSGECLRTQDLKSFWNVTSTSKCWSDDGTGTVSPSRRTVGNYRIGTPKCAGNFFSENPNRDPRATLGQLR